MHWLEERKAWKLNDREMNDNSGRIGRWIRFGRCITVQGSYLWAITNNDVSMYEQLLLLLAFIVFGMSLDVTVSPNSLHMSLHRPLYTRFTEVYGRY